MTTTTKVWTEVRTAKDPVAYVARLDEAGRTLGWGGKPYRASLSGPSLGTTKSGRTRFTVRFESEES